ncbi:MAG: ATP synthase F1 subunit gamma [Clostridia bacterium]|nr:ATP synthase F1 subunit gamma [Clostridia bacterium]
MGGASARDVKNRIHSVESTMHITKAMQLVASSKLKKAKERMESSRAFFTALYDTLSDLAAANGDFSSVFVREREVRKNCFVVVAGDRGLAGGYNSNVFRTVHETAGDTPFCVLPVGKKALEYFRKKRIEIVSEDYAVVSSVDLAQCSTLGKQLAESFRAGLYDAVYLVYTDFVSMLLQQPAIKKLLPLSVDNTHARKKEFILYEPSASGVFNQIIPEYLSGMAYGAICESYASELAARRTAMDSATKNASDMIDALSLQYNRARQGAITQEITEIVAGSEGSA